MISWPWVAGTSSAAIQLDPFPNLVAWKRRIGAREAVKRALAQTKAVQSGAGLAGAGPDADEARKVLFGQRAR